MKYLSETTMLVVLLAVLVACLVPVFGTGAVGMITHSVLVIVFAAFAAFFWREHPQDEREVTHQMFAGRVAFFVGVTMLLGGMLYQVYVMHSADHFLIATVIAMLAAKTLALLYSRRHC